MHMYRVCTNTRRFTRQSALDSRVRGLLDEGTMTRLLMEFRTMSPLRPPGSPARSSLALKEGLWDFHGREEEQGERVEAQIVPSN